MNTKKYKAVLKARKSVAGVPPVELIEQEGQGFRPKFSVKGNIDACQVSIPPFKPTEKDSNKDP
ncbi:hypothetical protein [Pleurocapsa sp. PCC 7319]|uniref:hypothetical protein n=1 Tax=Pleurocapsa sp. PCC 7319 TaxID=118161 RepID=UPI0003498101|nr:hypothetical protein [Pleurocapsa sp. PCC 7319]